MLLEYPLACRSVADLVERHGRVFAEWLRGENEFPADTLAKAASHVPEEFGFAWRAAVAEEWLLARNCGVTGDEIPEYLREAQPFSNGLRLVDLTHLSAAVAVIPLDLPPSGATARVWVVKDRENTLAAFANAGLSGVDDFFPKAGCYRIFVSGYDPGKVEGPSWQLGAMLARQALDNRHDAAVRKLAATWILTGSVSTGQQLEASPQIEHVGLGTKARLPKSKRDGDRFWLLPAANERPGEESYQELASLAAGRLHFACSLADAWNHVTGEGAILAPDQSWPRNCEEVHGFVSDSQGPFLAFILHTLPKRVVLWTSKTMKMQADELCEALSRICAVRNINIPKIEPMDLPESSDTVAGHESGHAADLLAATERVLAAHRTLVERHGSPILFNNTGGNFLHRTAAVRRASLNPRLWLAYRDGNNAKTPDFTLLRHHLGQLLTGLLRMDPASQKTEPPIDWHGLVKHWRLKKSQRDGPEPTSAEQIEALVAAASPKSHVEREQRPRLTGQWEALFVFQCKGIQPFMLGSDKLKDMLGATEIISALPEGMINRTIEFLGLKDVCFPISQAAGSARVLFRTQETACKLAHVWRMVCAHAAPGMEAVQTVQVITDGNYLAAVNKAEQDLVRQRNQPLANLPEVMPPMLRCARTGHVAVEKLVDNLGEKEDLDAATVAKRRARRKRQDSKDDDKFPAIYGRFGLQGTGDNSNRVPKMMEDIAGKDYAFVAVLHADGNGMGKMFIRLERELKKLAALSAPHFHQALSKGIIEVGEQAAQAGVGSIRTQLERAAGHQGCWPLLPVVLAGDDLTVVLRADLAVPFVKTFLHTFECKSRELFLRLLGDERFAPFAPVLRDALGPCLTAGAGIAFVKARYPFALAYQLTESLAGFAKREAKKHLRGDGLPPSTLAFHKVTGAVVRESFDELREGELKGPTTRLLMSQAPYIVGEHATPGQPMPSLSQLETLAKAVVEVPRGQVRELLSLLREDLGRAEKHYQRFREQATKEAEPERQAFAEALDTLLGTVGGKCHRDGYTPMQDAWTLANFDSREDNDR